MGVLLGTAAPIHIHGLAEYTNVAQDGAWVELTIPDGLHGEKTSFALLSWRLDTDYHLYVVPDPVGGSTPSATGAALLHSHQHNPTLLNVIGLASIHVLTSAGSSKQVRLAPVGNASAGDAGAILSAPLQIAADSKTYTLTNAATTAIVVPQDSNGDWPDSVLLAWDDATLPIWLSFLSFAPGFPIMPLAMNPCILDCSGRTTFYARCLAGTGPTDIHVTPLENR